MPLTRHDWKPGGWVHARSVREWVVYPASDTDMYLADGDPQLRIVGTELIGGGNPIPAPILPPNCSVTFSYIDAAGTGSTMTFLISGQNQFGEAVSETLVIPTGAGTKRVHTMLAYRSILSIVVTATAGTDAADTLEVGYHAGDDTNRLRLGIPVKLNSGTFITNCTKVSMAVTGSTGLPGSRRPLGGIDTVNHTFQLTQANGITGGEILELRFRPDVIS